MINKFYLGITNDNWIKCLKSNQSELEECINFWTPGQRTFSALEPGELFLFKLHNKKSLKLNGEIVGGAYFKKYEVLSIEDAWGKYGIGNGAESKEALEKRISSIRGKEYEQSEKIGCIILKNPFFFKKENYICEPNNWTSSIVRGKTYSVSEDYGRELYEKVLLGLCNYEDGCDFVLDEATSENFSIDDEGEEVEIVAKVRLNQGVFRSKLLERYSKCCLCNVSKERFLIASHIKPWRDSTSKEKLDIDNGFLMCRNHDVLFDKGFITFDDNGKIIISEELSDSDREALNVNENMQIELTEGNKKYLKYHREIIKKV